MNLFSRYCVGIDIGEKTTHLVELKRRRRNLEITNVATGSDLKKLVKNCHSRHVALALPSSQVMRKTIFVDKHLSELEINYYIQSNLHAFFSAHPDNLYVDFTTDSTVKHDLTQREITVFAAKSECINARLELVKKSSLTPKIITIENDVLQETVPQKKPNNKPYAIIHTKESTANVSVLYKNRVIFSQEAYYDTPNALQDFSQRSLDDFLSKNSLFTLHKIYTCGDDNPKKIHNSTLTPLLPSRNIKHITPQTTLSYALAKRGLQ